MKIVIDIPEAKVPKGQGAIEIPFLFVEGKVCKAGGCAFDVLPKGHGRLIDADELIKGRVENDYTAIFVNTAPTIIEADKAESEVEDDAEGEG